MNIIIWITFCAFTAITIVGVIFFLGVFLRYKCLKRTEREKILPWIKYEPLFFKHVLKKSVSEIFNGSD